MPGKKNPNKESKLDDLEEIDFDERKFDDETEAEISEVKKEMKAAGLGEKTYSIPGTKPRLVTHKFLANQWDFEVLMSALKKLEVANLTRLKTLKKYPPHIGEWYLIQFTEELDPENVKSRTKKLDSLAFKSEAIYYGFDSAE